MRPLFAALVVVGVAGCLTSSPVADSFPDAEDRFERHGEDLDATFTVPDGNRTVVVAVHYLLEADSTFAVVVRVVDGPDLAHIDQVGPVEERDAAWLTVRNATAGTWRIVADLEGEGSYVFGTYFRTPA